MPRSSPLHNLTQLRSLHIVNQKPKVTQFRINVRSGSTLCDPEMAFGVWVLQFRHHGIFGGRNGTGSGDGGTGGDGVSRARHKTRAAQA